MRCPIQFLNCTMLMEACSVQTITGVAIRKAAGYPGALMPGSYTAILHRKGTSAGNALFQVHQLLKGKPATGRYTTSLVRWTWFDDEARLPSDRFHLLFGMTRWQAAAITFYILFGLAAAEARDEQIEITKLYQRGLVGDKQAVIDCITTLEALLKNEPNNQLARVYLGSAYTLRSRDLSLGPQKLLVLKKGIALMDEAVAATPDDAHVRLVRALTNQSLPFFIGRRAAARQDFEELVAIVSKNPEKLAPGDRQLLFLNAGIVAKQGGDKARASDLWKRGLRTPVDPKLTQELKAALAGK